MGDFKNKKNKKGDKIKGKEQPTGQGFTALAFFYAQNLKTTQSRKKLPT